MYENEVMPWDDIPDDDLLPEGILHFEGIELKEEISQNTGKRMYVMSAKVLEPTDYAGQWQFEYFVVGSDEEPLKYNPKARGAIRMKACLLAANVPQTGTFAQTCMAFQGTQFLAKVLQKVDGDQTSAYYGQTQNRFGNFYKAGTQVVAVKPDKLGVGGAVEVVAPPVKQVVGATSEPGREVVETTATIPPPANEVTPENSIPCMACAADGSIKIPMSQWEAHIREVHQTV